MRTSQSQQRGGRGQGPRGDPDQEVDGGGAPVPVGAGAEGGGTLGPRAGPAPPLQTGTDFISEVRGQTRGVSKLPPELKKMLDIDCYQNYKTFSQY